MGSTAGSKTANTAPAIRAARRAAHTAVKVASMDNTVTMGLSRIHMGNQQPIILGTSSDGSAKAGSCAARTAGSVVCAPGWRIGRGGVRFLCAR